MKNPNLLIKSINQISKMWIFYFNFTGEHVYCLLHSYGHIISILNDTLMHEYLLTSFFLSIKFNGESEVNARFTQLTEKNSAKNCLGNNDLKGTD